MKNVEMIISRSDVHDYVMNLWKTDLFRDSHRNGEFIHAIVDQFGLLPRLFCETTNDHLERAHFSTWWGAMMHREGYDNPVIADLYWLHEFHHAGNMPYVAGIGKAAFDEKMQRSELEASVLSEIQVYFEMPGSRQASFGHPIYADRYLNDANMHLLWRSNKPVALETLRVARRDVMASKPEHLMDLTEIWIRRFAEQNAAYSIVWSDRYGEVERHMAEFQLAAFRNSRRDAIFFHRDWLEAEANNDTKDHIPFRLEAELSTAFYWANKTKHQIAMKAEATRLRTDKGDGRS